MKSTILSILLITTCCISAFSQEAPEDVLDRVLNSTHGLELASSSGDTDLTTIQQNPGTYIPLIQADLIYPTTLELNSYLAFAQNAPGLIELLSYLDEEDSKATLASLYYEAAEDMDALEVTFQQILDQGDSELLVDTYQLYSAVITVHGAVLTSLTDLNDNRVLDHVKSRLGVIDDSGIRQMIIKYNNKTGSGESIENESTALVEGWQLFGLPVDPVDPNYAEIFSSVSISDRPYGWTGEGYAQVETMETGNAYWVDLESPGAQQITGTIKRLLTMDVTEGWNMIAVPNCAPNDFHRFQINDENHIVFFTEQIYGYAENGYYLINDFMSADQGYWLEVDADKTIHMDCDHPTGSKTGYSPPVIPESFGMLSVQDARGGSQNLYFGGTLPGIDQRSFNMPPRPFENNFDARLSGDTRLTEDDAAIIRFLASQYPLTIELTRPPTSASGRFVLEEFAGDRLVDTRTIAPGAPLQVTNETVTILRVRPE